MNKKSLAVLSLLLLFSLATMAQGGFHIGVKGGVNMFKVDGKSFNEEFKFGYNLGGFMEINFGKKWGIQPEVMWNQSNTKTSTQFKDIYNTSLSELRDVKLNYLSIPLLLSFRPSKFITLQAGPQFGVLINQDNTLLQNGKNAFKQGDLSLLGGVQLNISSLKIGGRYAIGLNNINDIDNQDKWTSRGFQLYLGLRIF